MSDLKIPEPDEQEVFIVPDFDTENGWGGKCYLIMKDRGRALKVPAVMASWRDATTDTLSFQVSMIDILSAEPL